MYKLSLAHLYPKLLNLYGDNGNITTLKKRCEWRGIDLCVEEINSGDKINPEAYDLYFISGGQALQQVAVAKELKENKEALKTAANSGAVILAISGGYQLLGEYYQVNDTERLEGIELLDAYSIADGERFIGNVTAKSSFLTSCELVGFENHNGLTFLKEGTEPFAMVKIGKGNNGKDKTEGARKNNVFGTYLHGPLLPKNPHFADYLIGLALERKYNEKIELLKLNDDIENSAHSALAGKKY